MPQVLEDGSWLVTAADVEAIAAGCAVLGCGGGGSPHLACLKLLREMARCAAATNGPVRLRDDLRALRNLRAPNCFLSVAICMGLQSVHGMTW